MRTDPVGCTKEEDKDVFQNIYEVKQLAQEVQPVEEKPWRKSGADISDYFNYGFNEESWKTYCRKYAKLQAFQTQHIAKVMRERAKYEEVVSCAPSTSGRPSKKSSRQRKASSTGRGGKAGSRRREKERPCCTNAAKDTQVVAEISHKKNNVANYDLPRSINADTVFSFVPPPSSLFQYYQSVSPISMQGRDNLGNTDEPSTSMYPYLVGNMATDSTMIDAAKAWECYIKQKHDRDRDRSTEHGCDKGRSCKDRDRGKKSSISSHNSVKKHMKRRDPSERLFKRRRIERVSSKKKQKDEKERSRKTSQSRRSNISGKDDGKDRKKRHHDTKGKDVRRAWKATLPTKKGH
ncbi:pre-mRNA 3'-end-processing factor FIP1 [Girardinichthys multiradiatus]|uniref:pre-mRNA 3'-end-processing factor FIP1 n=1 Tax=Girardinichthys multiradiatus TaxID=208333 RepID=UPI001FAB84F9|nr:pre-mRNA 3'-end-processing factor FIP1 [Girardinichthys multiradiatus]